MRLILKEQEDGYPSIAIRTPQDAFEHSKQIAGDTEVVACIFLNTKNKMIALEILAGGGINGCVLDHRPIFRAALMRNASNIIIVHNHPTGELTPSVEDLAITRKLVEAGKILNIMVHDHIIISSDSYYSMRERGIVTFGE